MSEQLLIRRKERLRINSDSIPIIDLSKELERLQSERNQQSEQDPRPQCEFCEIRFEKVRSDQRFCSVNCRVRNWQELQFFKKYGYAVDLELAKQLGASEILATRASFFHDLPEKEFEKLVDLALQRSSSAMNSIGRPFQKLLWREQVAKASSPDSKLAFHG